MATIGDRIRDRRLELGWTQDALAQKAGISKSFLSDLENGKRSVGAENLQGIALALNLSLDFLMSGEGASQNNKQVQVPASLSTFAQSAGLSFREVMMLLEMHGTRSSRIVVKAATTT